MTSEKALHTQQALLDIDTLGQLLGLPHPPTPQQRQVIQAPLRPCAVVAGAGSGKTQTMGLRVVWLVANHLVQPEQVVGLTFTRKAAGELTSRIRSLLWQVRQLCLRLSTHAALSRGERGLDPAVLQWAQQVAPAVLHAVESGAVTVSTYHSFAADVVAQHGVLLGVEPSTRLIGQAQRWQIMRDVCMNYDGPMFGVTHSVETVITQALEMASEMAEHLVSAEQVLSASQQWRELLAGLPAGASRSRGKQPAQVSTFDATLLAREQLLPLIQAFEQYKREHNLMDFGDQVALAARIAQQVPSVGQQLRQRFAVVLLDEYQDTGEAQRQLLTNLFGQAHPVCAVGDPRQSIYGWRGASAGNLERFGMDFAPVAGEQASTPTFGLTTSFRNGEHILQVANVVAQHLPSVPLASAGSNAAAHEPLQAAAHRRADALGQGQPGRVLAALFDTQLDEAQALACQISALGQGEQGLPWSQVAVLARTRAALPVVQRELQALGVPCHIVGVGGLLSQPEVADVLAYVQVLVDPLANQALARLLVGPRWALGPHDLAALGQHARRLVQQWQHDAGQDCAPEQVPQPPVHPSLVEALDDLLPADSGPEGAAVDARVQASFTVSGWQRLQRLAGQLRELRLLVGLWLPDLLTQVIRAVQVEVEVLLPTQVGQPMPDPVAARANLAALVNEAAQFAEALAHTQPGGGSAAQGWMADAGLSAFLAYVQAAAEQERGLELAQDAEPSQNQQMDSGSVTLMTVHAAKGLEWDAVFVVGMTEKVFPQEGKSVGSWTDTVQALPFELRGDRDELPRLDPRQCTDQKACADQLKQFRGACKQRRLGEEWRLAYVAVTRARLLLWCSGWRWGNQISKPRGVSVVLEAVREVAQQLPDGAGEVPVWAPPPEVGTLNPMVVCHQPPVWPIAADAREHLVVEAAQQVREALREQPCPPGGDGAADELESVELEALEQQVQLVVRQREAARRAVAGRAAQPAAQQLSVSALVTHAGTQVGAAASPPQPQAEAAPQVWHPALAAPPTPAARLGIRFHDWVQTWWDRPATLPDFEVLVRDAAQATAADGALLEGAVLLEDPLDVGEGELREAGVQLDLWLLQEGELPGREQPGQDVQALQAAFRASRWAKRRPAYLEFPFAYPVGGVVIRGRIDAVFADDPQGFIDIVDWKTGSLGPQTGPEAWARQVQLGVYRLAWHELTGVPLERIRVAFHEVGTNTTRTPNQLLTAAELEHLVTQMR